MTITNKHKIFVDKFLEHGKLTGNYREAAEIAGKEAGYSPNTSFAEIFNSDGVKELFMKSVGIELARIVPKLLHALEAVIDNPATPGAKNIIAAAATLLDRAGVTKVEKIDMEVKAPDGVIVLPPKNN